MSEAEGALLLGYLARDRAAGPSPAASVPMQLPVVLRRAGHAQPAHLEAGDRVETLRSLLCTGKREVCLCSLETGEEGAQCFIECAELVWGTLFGGAVVGFGLTLGKGSPGFVRA